MDAMRNRSAITCTTHKLNALNSRLSDASADCLVLTEQVRLLSRNMYPRGMMLVRVKYVCPTDLERRTCFKQQYWTCCLLYALRGRQGNFHRCTKG